MIELEIQDFCVTLLCPERLTWEVNNERRPEGLRLTSRRERDIDCIQPISLDNASKSFGLVSKARSVVSRKSMSVVRNPGISLHSDARCAYASRIQLWIR